MSHYTIYSKPGCSSCDKAKQLFEIKNIDYKEVIIDVGQQKQEGKEYISVADLKALIPGVTSVPQIFLGGVHIGGFNAIKERLEA